MEQVVRLWSYDDVNFRVGMATLFHACSMCRCSAVLACRVYVWDYNIIARG